MSLSSSSAGPLLPLSVDERLFVVNDLGELLLLGSSAGGGGSTRFGELEAFAGEEGLVSCSCIADIVVLGDVVDNDGCRNLDGGPLLADFETTEANEGKLCPNGAPIVPVR